MTKFLKGSKTIISNDGKNIFDVGKNSFKATNDVELSSNDAKTNIDLKDNTVVATDPAVGLMSTYFIGEILANLAGGSLNGITYTYYVLTIKIHHNFSTDNPNLTPLYEFWRDYQYASQQMIKASLGTVVNQGSAGTWSEWTDHGMVRNFANTVYDEYMYFSWAVQRLSGTIVIPAVALRLIPHIKYFNQPLTITNATVEGGGGGTLYENFDFYI